MIFFFNDTATTEIYTLSLHDALPISSAILLIGSAGGSAAARRMRRRSSRQASKGRARKPPGQTNSRSEEHTSELQSRQYLVCRLLLEKKKNRKHYVGDLTST